MEKLCILFIGMAVGCLLLHREGLMPPKGGGRTGVFLLLLLAVGARCLLMDRAASAEEDSVREAITWFRGAGGFPGVRSYTGPFGVGLQYILAACAGVPRGSLYIFKCIELVAALFLAWGCQRCVRAVIGNPRPRLWAFLLSLLLPSGILEGAGGMGQSLYALFPLLAAAAVLSGRFALGGALLGAAAVFQPGILWVLPVFWVFPAVRENTGRTLLALVGGDLLLTLPALLLGRSGSLCFPFWPGLGDFARRSAALGAPGIYALSPALSRAAGIAAYAVLAGLALYRLTGRDAVHDRRRQLSALAMAALAMGGLLPGMPPAVLYGGEVLTLALCAMEPGMIPAAVCASLASGGALLELLFPALSPLSLPAAAVLLLLTLALLLGNVLFRR